MRDVTLRRVVVDQGGNSVELSAILTLNTEAAPPPPPPDPLTFGWCPKNSNTTDFNAMIAKYPNPHAVRLYSGVGDGILQWDSSLLKAVPAAADLHYSWKDWGTTAANITQLRTHMTQRPATRTGKEYRTYRHEPEQGTSAGDLDPAVWRSDWTAILDGIADHPRRSEFQFGPVFTEYWVGKNETSWRSLFSSVLNHPGCDFFGIDIYDTGYERYRGAVQRNALTLRLADEFNLPIVIGEWGIGRKFKLNNGTSYDPTGSICKQEMLDNMAYLQNQARVKSVMWFWRGEDILDETLTNSDGATYTRTNELDAFNTLRA